LGNNSTRRQATWRREEIQLLELVSIGFRNKEIAGQLRVSESDVKKRLSRLMRVLAARSRTGLVRAAIAKGVIVLPSGGRDI